MTSGREAAEYFTHIPPYGGGEEMLRVTMPSDELRHSDAVPDISLQPAATEYSISAQKPAERFSERADNSFLSLEQDVSIRIMAMITATQRCFFSDSALKVFKKIFLSEEGSTACRPKTIYLPRLPRSFPISHGKSDGKRPYSEYLPTSLSAARP